jgi:hypothetical protein
MKQYLNESENSKHNSINSKQEDLDEPIKTASLLALCLELTIKP